MHLTLLTRSRSNSPICEQLRAHLNNSDTSSYWHETPHSLSREVRLLSIIFQQLTVISNAPVPTTFGYHFVTDCPQAKCHAHCTPVFMYLHTMIHNSWNPHLILLCAARFNGACTKTRFGPTSCTKYERFGSGERVFHRDAAGVPGYVGQLRNFPNHPWHTVTLNKSYESTAG